jgi:hypothetical protein
MQQLVLESRDISRVEEVLIRYLPGLNPGLLPLSTTRGLLAGPTLLALTREYGAAGVEGIFGAAGVTGRQPVSDEAALELARQRDIASLPPRAPQPADTRLWHLDEVQVRGAWSLLGGVENIDWTGVKVPCPTLRIWPPKRTYSAPIELQGAKALCRQLRSGRRTVLTPRSAARMLLPITTAAAQPAIGASAKQFEQRRQQAMKLRFDQLRGGRRPFCVRGGLNAPGGHLRPTAPASRAGRFRREDSVVPMALGASAHLGRRQVGSDSCVQTS